MERKGAAPHPSLPISWLKKTVSRRRNLSGGNLRVNLNRSSILNWMPQKEVWDSLPKQLLTNIFKFFLSPKSDILVLGLGN